MDNSTPSDWIATLRRIRDQKDAINAQLKDIGEQEDEAERGLLDAMAAAGFDSPGDKVSTEFGTAIRQEKWRAKYDPERWGEFFKWCAENDRTDLIQRRTADARILELQDKGLPMPPGVEMEPFTALLFRRA
jgi:hypothetical protein